MTQGKPTVEELLARLNQATRELREAASQPGRVWDLVKERGWIARELAERGVGAKFSGAELDNLGAAIRGGEQLRQSLVLGRETAREQLRELRAARRVQNEFRPYRETSGGHVAVEG